MEILRSLGVLDTPPEPDYDDLTRLAAHICQVPIALITLIDKDRQWFKSKVGIEGTGTSREMSFCAHVINEPGDDVFVVPDARDDPRFQGNPHVQGDPNVRFYAGAPLVTHDGWPLGTLCVIDREPRQLSPEQLQALSSLRRHVINALELRRLVENQNRIIADLERTRRALDEARHTAENATRAKAEFLAAMSHEIRTPMNAVIGMTTLLRNSPLNAEQRDNVELIHQSGDHLLNVINDVLDFSKIEAGCIELEYARCDVSDCVRTAIALVAPRAREKALALSTQIDPDVPAFVAADSTRIRQILVNLLSNGVKFTDRGGLSVSVSSTSLAAGQIELLFIVRDTGIGIPPDRLHRLFKPFTQVDASTTRTHGGTGLGLSISKRLAELHGGRMWVESEIGQGSSFHFTLIAQPSAAPEAAQLPGAPHGAVSEFDATFAERHPARILVAEDNAVNQKVISRMLEKLGYRPHIVSDGQAAVDTMQQRDFDLIFMDVEMPRLDGPSATRGIRTSLPSACQPIIVAVTAHALAGSREQLLRSGMDGYISKPVRLAELTATLASLDALRHAAKATR